MSSGGEMQDARIFIKSSQWFKTTHIYDLVVSMSQGSGHSLVGRPSASWSLMRLQ